MIRRCPIQVLRALVGAFNTLSSRFISQCLPSHDVGDGVCGAKVQPTHQHEVTALQDHDDAVTKRKLDYERPCLSISAVCVAFVSQNRPCPEDSTSIEVCARSGEIDATQTRSLPRVNRGWINTWYKHMRLRVRPVQNCGT